MDFSNSRTYTNLKNAFEGELKASTKYRIYASKAREDGYQQIGEIFDETAGNEQAHAEIWFKLLNEGVLPDTLNNLQDAQKGEVYEWTKMYREYANIARQEGFNEIAQLFEGVGSIERHHDYRFKVLADNIKNEKVFCKDKEVIWICMECGNIIRGQCAPKVCPVCGYPQAYSKLNCENY